MFNISLFRDLFVACFLLAVPALGQESPLAQAQALLREGKAESSLPILLELHRAEPSNANLCQQIGIAYTQMSDLTHAEEFYREAVRLNPEFYAARKNLGTVLWFLNRKEESEREFLVVTKSIPDDPVPNLYLGLAAAGRHEFAHAKEQFERAGTLASENPEVALPVLESYLATRDLSFPASLLRRLTEAEPADTGAISRVGALFLQYGYYDQAAIGFEKIISAHKDSAETWRLLAETYERQQRPDHAYAAYSRALALDPNSEDSYLMFSGFASAHANNNYAMQVVARGLERLPQSANLRFEQGVLLALTGDRTKAHASFSEASRLKPDWNLPLLALGVLALESGNAVEAANRFEEARMADPRDARSCYLYALALSKGDDSPANRATAIAALRKAIEFDPHYAASHALLGRFELTAARAQAAAREWETALKLDPGNTTALYQLSLLYQKQGRTEQAQQFLKRFQRVKAAQRADETQLIEILKVVPRRAAH